MLFRSASTNLGPSSLAYSQAAADARFATIDMVSGGGINNVTATNISKNVAQSATNDYNSTILARRYIQQGTTNIQFQNESTNVPSQSEGLVYYDNATHTLAYYNDQSAVTVNIGQEEHVRVVNKTSGTISNGQPVTIFGFQGNRPKAILAYSTNIDLPYWSCIGLATHDIAVNAEGLVTAYGVVNGIDTRAYGSNTIYLSTNAGTLTTNLPPSGYNVVKVGIALNNTVNGSIWVSPVQPVHQDDVTGLTNRLAQIEGNTNFTSIHVTDNSTFESDVTANALKATDIYSGQRPLSVEIAQIGTDGYLDASGIAVTNVATLQDVCAATNGLSGGGVSLTQVSNTAVGMGMLTNHQTAPAYLDGSLNVGSNQAGFAY